MSNFNKYLIDGDALIQNIKKIKRYVGNSTKICAVVKANAYGVGVKNVCNIIGDYVDFYAVVNVEEALEIRQFDTQKDILVLGASNLEMCNECAKANITIAVSGVEEVRYLTKHLNTPINVHLKINTGMNRFGIKTLTQLREVLKEVRKSNLVSITGVYTHFATKAENLDFVDCQYEKFCKFLKQINIKNLIVHCANSFVATSDKLKICNMVRIGFSMYGHNYGRLNLKNVVSINSRVVFINHLKKGESVGYDRTFVAKKDMRVAVVPIGYADGFARGLSNNFAVLINNEKAPVLGRVCMDCFMADITNIKNVYVGSEVNILSSNEPINLYNYATALNTSPYEILTNFRTRRMDVVIK